LIDEHFEERIGRVVLHSNVDMHPGVVLPLASVAFQQEWPGYALRSAAREFGQIQNDKTKLLWSSTGPVFLQN
jgi:hypothetical protein